MTGTIVIVAIFFYELFINVDWTAKMTDGSTVLVRKLFILSESGKLGETLYGHGLIGLQK